MAPERIQTQIGHLENAADVRRLPLVEERVGRRRIEVLSVGSLKESKSHERVQKIARRARMESQASLEFFERSRMLRDQRERFHLDCAQQRLRRPEREASLKNVLRSRLLHVFIH